jgi:hypothetical protein
LLHFFFGHWLSRLVLDKAEMRSSALRADLLTLPCPPREKTKKPASAKPLPLIPKGRALSPLSAAFAIVPNPATRI